MPNDGFDVVPLSLAARSLPDLMRRVNECHHRVELVDADTGAACVLISKTELDCLESALECLSQLPAVSQLHNDVKRLAQFANETEFTPAGQAISSISLFRFPVP